MVILPVTERWWESSREPPLPLKPWNSQWWTCPVPPEFLESLRVARARDAGACEWTVFKEVAQPLITLGIIAAGVFGFALSYD